MKSNLKAVAFDLDDTLLDTTGLLIPTALTEAYHAMIVAGLPADLDQCMELKTAFAREQPKDLDLFEYVARSFSLEFAELTAIVASGRKAFYQRDIPRNLEPFEGTHSVLNQLQRSYSLYLVTAGDPGTQQQKVDVLKLEPYFQKLYFVDGLMGRKKQHAFERIIHEGGISPTALLSVGNRRDKEIEEAKRLGAVTCLIQYGEYSHLKPINPYQKPDYEISHIQDLISVCSL